MTKRAIVIQADHRFMSALVSKDTVPALHVGDPVVVVHDLQLDDIAIGSGERGKVVSVCDDASGHIEIEFDRIIPSLHQWRNVLLAVPFDTPTIIGGLALATCLEAKEMSPARSQPRQVSRRHAIAAALVAFLLGWAFAPDEVMVPAHAAEMAVLDTVLELLPL